MGDTIPSYANHILLVPIANAMNSIQMHIIQNFIIHMKHQCKSVPVNSVAHFGLKRLKADYTSFFQR